MDRWDDVEAFLKAQAEDDLAATGEIHPALAAFTGDELRFVAWLRWFEKGKYHRPLIELFTLSMALDADRLALSLGGRAWSLEDPIPPVTEDADLRQRVLVIHMADGCGARVECRSALHAFELRGQDEVAWLGRHDMGAGGRSWIMTATRLAVENRDQMDSSDEEAARQARRVAALGHRLWIPPPVAARLRAL